ncbi:hypothetical protein BpHYR1_007798 [Brachionus plicatilis]|uniref:Uncharacterized protein n=1 Tax=Brachionus plicatilis TaxID=10195 RepID=A0A3M7PQH3_BRAPC|nr:hypothetical protein BpHYR1_007798 [Brachionus plicatilis]
MVHLLVDQFVFPDLSRGGIWVFWIVERVIPGELGESRCYFLKIIAKTVRNKISQQNLVQDRLKKNVISDNFDKEIAIIFLLKYIK